MEVVWRWIDVRARERRVGGGQTRWRAVELRSRKVTGRVGRGNAAGADRTSERDGRKRQEARSRSRLIRGRGNVRREYRTADGEQRPA